MYVCRWPVRNQSRQGLSAVPSLLPLLGWFQWQGGFWSGLLCHLAASSFSAAIFFCLWILPTWCSMHLKCAFFPHYINFTILGVFSSSAPLGTRGRRQVWRGWCDLLAILLLLEDGFSCGKSLVLSLSWVLALVECKLCQFIAVNDLGCQWVPLF